MILATSTVTSSLGITSSMLQGVFDEFIAILPTVLPVAIGYLGIRKAVAFVLGTVRRA